MEELAVVTGTDLINGRWVEVNEDRTGDVFAVAGLAEEGLERSARVEFLGRLGVDTAISLEAMLQKV